MKPDHPLRRRLRDLASLEPSAAATQRAVASAQTAVMQDARAEQSHSVASMIMAHRKTTLAAAGCLLVAAAAGWTLLVSGNGNVAFAQVLQQLERVKTVQYTESRTSFGPGGRPQGPTTVTKYWILGRSRQRQEIVSTTDGDPLPEGQSWSKAPVGVASVSNLVTGEMVSLDANKKTFSRVRAILSLDPETGEVNEEQPRPAPEVDFYRQIQEFPGDEAERLPARSVDGKQVVGFRTVERIERPGGVDTWTHTYWISTAENLPVRIEIEFTSTHPQIGELRGVLSDIMFDEPLDESLFSTDPPEGYSMVEE